MTEVAKAVAFLGSFIVFSFWGLPKVTDRQQRGLEKACQCRCVAAPEETQAQSLDLFDRWIAHDHEIVARWGGGYWECRGRQ